MQGRGKGGISKKLLKQCSCFMIALAIVAVFALPMIVISISEAGNEIQEPADVSEPVEAGGELETRDNRDLIYGNPNIKPELMSSEQEPAGAISLFSEASELTTSANITFYKTTTGGGEGVFGSEIFNFSVTRVADKYGNPWTEVDETYINNYGGYVSVQVGPNRTAEPVSFIVENLKAPNGQARYFFKISEEHSAENWNYEDRAFVIQILVVEVDGSLLVPKQGQEWFYQGMSYDSKGGGNPFPPNEYNTFINEFTGAGAPTGRLRIKKNDFNNTPAYPNEKFEFQIISNIDGPVDLTAPGITIRKFGGRGQYSGSELKKGKFTLTYDTDVQITGLPIGDYTITESVEGYEIRYNVNGGSDVEGAEAPVTIAFGEDSYVIFTNAEEDINTSLTIRKLLSGDYENWGVNADTIFRVKVKDARGRYLTFSGTAPNYTYTETSATGSEIRFSMGQPALISGIPAGTICTVEEVIPSGALYTANYSSASVQIPKSVNGEAGKADVTITNTYVDHGVGSMIIGKRLEGSYRDWGADENTVFTVVVKDVTDPGNVYNLHFRRLSNGNYEAVATGTGNPQVQFTAGKPAVLTMLLDDHVYEVEEIAGAHCTVSYTGNNSKLLKNGNINVTITNAYEHGTGDLVIGKKLAGSYGDWGVDEDTGFQARVKDVTDGNYVLFALQPDGRYLAVGNSNSPTTTKDTRELVRFSASRPVILTGLWLNHEYEVQEVDGPHYKAAYAGNNTVLPIGGNMNVTITNTFEHGEGSIVVKKVLEGFPGDWGVDENTVFSIRVKDDTDKNYLLFSLQEDGTYLAFGNNGSLDPKNDARILVPLTAGKPIVLTGLWANQKYVVEELIGSNYTSTYRIGDGVLPQKMPEGGNMNVTITNTFEHGIGNITINKTLAGRPDDWNVNENTVFTARVKDVTDDFNIYDVYFVRQADGLYKAVDNGDSPMPAGDPVIRFSASKPVTLVEMWENRIYEVVEDGGEHYTAQYTGNNAKIPDNGNMNVAIINTFGRDIGRLKISKANFISTPVKPNEAFVFVVKSGGNPLDLSADGISIRKTGGSGEYNDVNLSDGKFTLTYDTEITIFGIPKGKYTITEDATGYNTSYIVTNHSGKPLSNDGSEAAIEVVGSKETAVEFTNAEINTRPSRGETTNKPSEGKPSEDKPSDNKPSDTENDNKPSDEEIDYKPSNTEIDKKPSDEEIDNKPSGEENNTTNQEITDSRTTSSPSDGSGVKQADGGVSGAINSNTIGMDDTSLGMKEASSSNAEAQVQNPKTGDSTGNVAKLALLAMPIIGSIVVCFLHYRQRGRKGKHRSV